MAQNEGLPRALAEAETALNEAQKAEQTRSALTAEIADHEKQLREQTENSPDARALSGARHELENLAYNPAEHRTLREQLKDLETVEAQNAQLQVAEERQQKTLADLPEFVQKRDLAQQWLSEEKYAPEEQGERQQIRVQIQDLNYNAEHHQSVSTQLTSLSDAPAQHERLQTAERELESAQARHKTLTDRQTSLKLQYEQTQQKRAELDTAIDQAKSAVNEAKDLQKNIQDKRSARDQFLQQRAGLQTQIERCDALRKEQDSVDEKLKACKRDIRIYRELITAFGKDGIQALIIEQAIPEIEEEANRILSRLTDNRTQIAIESLRDLKKGGTRETLDIKISDELGERSYELYSGGEAFRVDFSIRIALSKLLASRTGTRLRTLVIDEGFGTQDTEGLDHLVEAIQAISQDFEKILVITHVESLKQAFPVR
ncbi:MAG: SbcC/MukB-like Walker B domain-containing protein, partial [Candidatus Latescibacteria bacterium]|nr:SbcC/MukB-like Walker B domain-containing protein [Candidatus Latescibacterota bacterium]